MAKIGKKINNGAIIYLQLLTESYRIGNKTRHRGILSLGKLETIDTKEDKKLLADTIEKFISGQQVLSLLEIKPEIEKLAREFADRIINEKLLDIKTKNAEPLQAKQIAKEDWQTVNLHSIRYEEVREIGSEWLCMQALNQLGLKDLLLNLFGQNELSVNISLMHIISRAVYPASEHKTAQWIKENSAVSRLCKVPLNRVDRFKLYAASKKLFRHKKAIENHLSVKTNELFDLEDKIVFYDLTNTYFEGRKQGSKLAKFGRSKEKRNDCKIVSMAAVINAEGFLKYSRIYRGNISDPKTLNETIEQLSANTSSTGRKPIIVMDAGIMTEENARSLKSKGYDFICVNRTKLRNYKTIEGRHEEIVIYDKNENPINLQFVEKPDCTDNYLYVRSQQKALKEASMNEHFSQHYEESLENIKSALSKKGGTKKLNRVWERIGRLKERYPTANRHYEIEVIPDQDHKNAIDIRWKKNQVKPKETEGVYFIRTSLPAKDEETLWRIYNTLTEIEATFRVLKTDLALRPVFHKHDQNIEAHLFLGLIAYQLVALIRYQLKQKGINHDWRNIVRIMNTQKEVLTTIKNKKQQTVIIKKCSVPSLSAKEIYAALNFETNPYYMKKSVVPEK
ncbi:MAG: IS1634 family transposase [Bacteroidetes bacterium]|nr:IS1634 family transposase [Bacteroidota bacterium]MBT7143795.1 IS1634 family transposase [Bacteroidota bacterium]MBT7490299.1 IS1634 family transposase [Bacteroidota bacterium]